MYIISKRIKQTFNHNSDIYINFKSSLIGSKYTKSNAASLKFPELVFSDVISKKKKNKINSSKSSINLINKNEDSKIINLGSSRSYKKRKKK